MLSLYTAKVQEVHFKLFWLPWLTILKPCLSTSQFHHVCGIYMQTDTHTLNMRVGTHHGYYYMNDESHVILAGLTQTINYNTGE